MDASLLHSIRAYLQYLIESGVEEVPGPPLPASGNRAARLPPDGKALEWGERLAAVQEALGECTRCPLSRTRQRIVFGEGNPCAEILFVGEAPGEDEDRTGRPFVGRAGQLLNQIIGKGMGLARAEVYICNVLKCRPPLNRTPREEEVEICLPFLKEQIAAIEPKVIVALGLPAVRALLKTDKPMHRLRGTWQSYRRIPVMPTYHPAYVLRNYTVSVRRQVWQDVLEVMQLLEEEADEPGGADG